jgi:tetratricopeptide (TPR) repeat protein
VFKIIGKVVPTDQAYLKMYFIFSPELRNDPLASLQNIFNNLQHSHPAYQLFKDGIFSPVAKSKREPGMEGKRSNTEMKRAVLIPLMFVLALSTNGQGRIDYNKRLYQSYIHDQMHLWKGIISEMGAEYEMKNDKALLYDLCFAYYGYIGYLISQENEKAAKAELEDAMKKTEELDRVFDGRHDVLALQGALLGYRIVLSKFTAMYLGPRSMKYIKTAYESRDIYFNCNVEMGNMLFYTPKILGGSKTEAIQHYEKAVDILETSKLKADHNWIYMNTVLLLANAYNENGRQDLACKLYWQLLKYEPAADWIRKDLYSKCKQP